jgi:hypothetical protein
MMNRTVVTRKNLHDDDDDEILRTTTPEERLGMMWRFTLDAWSFKENIDAEPRIDAETRLNRACFALMQRQPDRNKPPVIIYASPEFLRCQTKTSSEHS